MLMRDALLRRNHVVSAWIMVAFATTLLVLAGQAAAEEAAPAPAPAAAPEAPAAAPAAPAASPAAPAAPAAAPEAPEVGVAPVAPSAEEAAATGFGPAGLPITVAPAELQKDWRMLVHYFKLARFDLAKAAAEKVLAAKPTPETVLALVESPTTGYDLIITMVRVTEMGDVPAQILTLADEGARLKRTDAGRIQGNLLRLGQGPRAYFLAMKELAYSGPYVVPYAYAILQDPGQKELWPLVVRALVELGKPVVLPLTRALQTPSAKLRETIAMVLGDIGYPYSLPALKALIEDPAQPESVKAAATKAILKFGDESLLKTPAKTLYIELAEKYYTGKIVVADPRQPTTDLFEWVPGTGLIYRAAPSKAVNDILAARACADCLKVSPEALDAVAIWVSALMDMEAKTPGKTAREDDPFLAPTTPTVDFFAEAVGQQHLYKVLDRALRDQNTPVATRACGALENVANQDFLTLYGQADVGSPLVMALTYPDQRVRFAAAFALAAVRPTHRFTGSGKVIPALTEALNLEAQKSVLLVEPEADNRNRLQAKFKEAGWNVVTATTGNLALSGARAMLRIDTIIVSSHTRDMGAADLVALLRNDYETALTPIIVLSYPDDPTKAAWQELQIPYLTAVGPGTEVDGLVPRMDALKKKAGSMVLEPAEARAAGIHAANVLKDIAMTSHVFSAERARRSLLAALTNRPDELVVAVLGALAQIPDADITVAMAKVGVDAERSNPVRVAALKALGRAARTVGNKLPADLIAGIQNLGGTKNDELRDAAGEALGGLNLDAAEGAKMILRFGDVENPTAAPAVTPMVPPPPPAELPAPPSVGAPAAQVE